MRILILVLCFLAGPIFAQTSVNIRPDIPSVKVETAAGPFEITRDQNPDAILTGDWARISRPCPPFCIQPMIPAEGVTPIGEVEVLQMLQDPEAIVVDSRTSKWYGEGTIPGSISIPYADIADRLDLLGCELDFDGYVCENAKNVALFCNGMWCGQSPTAIRNMIGAGYPAARIFYYRGGMQDWRILGLSVVPGE